MLSLGKMGDKALLMSLNSTLMTPLVHEVTYTPLGV